MSASLSLSPRRFGPADLMFYAASLLVLSMMFSPFVLSISMWGLVAAAVWESAEKARETTAPSGNRWLQGLWQSLQRWASQPVLLLLSLLLLVPAISFFLVRQCFFLGRTDEGAHPFSGAALGFCQPASPDAAPLPARALRLGVDAGDYLYWSGY